MKGAVSRLRTICCFIEKARDGLSVICQAIDAAGFLKTCDLDEGKQRRVHRAPPFRMATPIKAASALPSSFTRAKSAARSGHRRIASAREALLEARERPTARFRAAEVIREAATPQAARTPSTTPRARPKANVEVRSAIDVTLPRRARWLRLPSRLAARF
jgi:hypothetical protein